MYNWQFVHSIDFWSLVLARACDSQAAIQRGGTESDLQPLVFPLAQVATGAIKLLNHARSYPFHLHILRSLVHLTRHTDVYVPLLPYFLPPLTTVLSPSHKAKASTVRPLDFETTLRAPQQYTGTRVYAEGVADETVFVLAEWLSTRAVHGSIAFPELVVPLVVMLRRALKAAKSGKGSGKEAGIVKALVERVEESSRWMDERRKSVTFAPGQMDDVARWQMDLRQKLDETPLGKYVRVQRKAREKRRKLVEKVRRLIFVMVYGVLTCNYHRRERARMRFWRRTRGDLSTGRAAERCFDVLHDLLHPCSVSALALRLYERVDRHTSCILMQFSPIAKLCSISNCPASCCTLRQCAHGLLMS